MPFNSSMVRARGETTAAVSMNFFSASSLCSVRRAYVSALDVHKLPAEHLPDYTCSYSRLLVFASAFQATSIVMLVIILLYRETGDLFRVCIYM